MITWNAAVAILCSLTDERRHRFLENRLQAAHNHPDPGTRYWIEKVSKQFVPGLQERLALTVAAMQGLAVYARNRQESHAYRIYTVVWTGDAALLVNPVTAAATGKLSVVCQLLPSHAIENHLVNADLYVLEKEFWRLIGRRSATDPRLATAGEQLIHDFVQKHGLEYKLTRRDFDKQMREEFPGATNPQLTNAWQKVMPKAWQGGGRPKKLRE